MEYVEEDVKTGFTGRDCDCGCELWNDVDIEISEYDFCDSCGFGYL